jgi:hypothetical protein
MLRHHAALGSGKLTRLPSGDTLPPLEVIMSSWLFHNPNFPLLSESNLRDKVSSNEGRYR